MEQVKYSIGQIIKHNKQHYRGIIIDVDYSFQPQGIHSPLMIKKNIATEHPWYRILVDNSNHITYVKESLLDSEQDDDPINHPELTLYLKENKRGEYVPHYPIN